MKRDDSALLPTAPPPGLAGAAVGKFPELLGRELCIFSRVSDSSELDEFTGWPGVDDIPDSSRKRRWAARCHCTACGGNWLSGWRGKKDGGPAIEAYVSYGGPRPEILPGIPGGGEPDVEQYCSDDGQMFRCPDCGAVLTAEHADSLKNGRLNRLMIATLGRAENRTAVLYWMVSRRYSGGTWGEWVTDTDPRAAAVLDEDRTIALYGWRGRWRPSPSALDPEDLRYYCHDANGSTMAGAAMMLDFSVPPQAGDTAEKSAVWEYLREGGALPVKYLRFWAKYPSAENLIKAGWHKALITALDSEWQRTMRTAVDQRKTPTRRLLEEDAALIADYTEFAPRRMICMTRDEIRQGRLWAWDADTLMTWMVFTSSVETGWSLMGPGDAGFFHQLAARYGLENLRRWANPDERVCADLREADRYLQRQERRHGLSCKNGMTMLMDYWSMLQDMAEDWDAVPRDRLWPASLKASHDRVARDHSEWKQRNQKFADFSRVTEVWAGLEWTDGKYCIRLPRTGRDLVREGDTLRHCVGSYSGSHLKGRLVLFVRRWRRPERSRYTLNEDVTGTRPHRIQLHGYLNDARRPIPADVEEFVKTWERDVLVPVFAAQKAAGRLWPDYDYEAGEVAADG